MKVAALLKLHDRTRSSKSISDNLGDGYLIRNNPVYRSIRQAVLKEGFIITPKQMNDYLAMPLTQLPTLLKKRVIPYVPNVAAIRAVEKKASGFFDIRHLPPLRANVIHHESAHGLAHRIRLRTVGIIEPNTLEDQRRLLIAYFLEESFANATESLLSVFSNDPAHEYFLSMNSYLIESKKTRTIYVRFLKHHDLEVLLRMLILSFLHANMLRPKISTRALDRLIHLSLKDQSQVSRTSSSLFRSVFESSQQLDSAFTVKTNFFCLALLGLSNPIQILKAVDVLSVFEASGTRSRSQFGDFLDELGRQIDF